MPRIPTTVSKKWKPYVPYIPTAALLLGLVWDSITLSRPDQIFDNVVVLGYLALSAVAIIVLTLRIAHEAPAPLLWLSIVQFSFGNLASALLILYSKSGTLAGSLIFLSLLALMLIGNEFLRERYAKRAHLHIAIWYVLLLTYTTLVVPILFGEIGFLVFGAGVVFAVAGVSVLLALIYAVSAERLREHLKRIIVSIAAMTIGFAALYTFNLIPPVPLALKDIGVYHQVERVGNVYEAIYEKPRWYAPWRRTSSTFAHVPGEAMHCFSAVFAPARLSAPIFHHWEQYDFAQDEWITRARIPLTISGGRDDGFRAYTETLQVAPGLWRCNVETERGALIGRTEVEVVSDEMRTLLEREL